ncbi:hypothetical protein ACIBEJ_31085 [Nonomuraea sp. NPDC050790]|uniref:hypothetical protein n=1 Tax=Nonomuraea sp. NPDC050790 TaxID=3364371 RepID=UPI0037A167BD
MTKQLREAMREWADEAQVPHDLADRALRRRARRPWGYGTLAVGVAALIAVVAVVVPRVPEVPVRPAVEITLPPRPVPAPTDVSGDLEKVPPKKMIAAGRYAIGAYWTERTDKLEGRTERLRRTWWLLDPVAKAYEKTEYAWVDVAPGLQVAAVLEGEAMGRRVGVLDLTTKQFLAWFDLDRTVTSVRWSPDGTKLLATAYTEYPGLSERTGKDSWTLPDSTRTGYYVIDVPANRTEFHPMPPLADSDKLGPPNPWQDLEWSLDGSLIFEWISTSPHRLYYSLDGQKRPAPDEQFSDGGVNALSPDGRLLLGDAGLPTKITEKATGAVVASQQVLQLHAWADNERVIAMKCARDCDNEFESALVLTSVDGKTETPLSGYQDTREDGVWRWVLTPR